MNRRGFIGGLASFVAFAVGLDASEPDTTPTRINQIDDWVGMQRGENGVLSAVSRRGRVVTSSDGGVTWTAVPKAKEEQ